jgi:hypothetical protein
MEEIMNATLKSKHEKLNPVKWDTNNFHLAVFGCILRFVKTWRDVKYRRGMVPITVYFDSRTQ